MIPSLELRGVSKRYGGAVALDTVDFDLLAGEVHGLIGENGAGKSTMMKLLAGVYNDYSGEMLLDGRVLRFASPADAQAHGIGMVYQELAVFPQLTVAENLFGRHPPTRRGLIDWRAMNRIAREHLLALGLDIDVTTIMGGLTVGMQQLIEIARVIFSGARIIILDEPTSALSPPETQRLFEFIGTLKQQGKTLIFISHFLEDVLAVSDRITVLKDGCKAAVLAAASTNKHQLVELMIGADARILQQSYEADRGLADPRQLPAASTATYTVERLTLESAFSNISFELRQGEILGMFGFMGAGQFQLARCLFGAERPDAGTMMLDGRRLDLRNTSDARAAGIAYVPENRRDSVVLSQAIYKNVTLAHLGRLVRGWLDQRAELQITQAQIEQVGVQPPKPLLPAGSLSGGNQQKVVLARWLTQQPRLLILSEPTRGMDVGAKDEVLTIIRRLRDQGVAIIVITTEPEILLSIADRALVVRKGHITAELSGRELSKEYLMQRA